MKYVLDRDVALGIIEPVPVGTPTTWCPRMVGAPKKTAPQTHRGLKRTERCRHEGESHHTPPSCNQVSIVLAQTIKTILYAWDWYHSFPQAYKYIRAPQGFHESGDGYTRLLDITVDMVRKTVT